jgi:hypothetical protein
MKNVVIITHLHVPSQKWFWYTYSADGQRRQYGPFKIEALAKKDAHYELKGYQ